MSREINKGNRKKKIISFAMAFTILLTSMIFSIPVTANAEARPKLPTQCIIGYWENWCSDETANLTLRQVNPKWDVIIVSFMLTDSSNVRAVFSPDNSLYPGGDQDFINDIKYCHQRGQTVLISLGGATGELHINSDSERKTFYDSACSIIEKYGFDGIDIDLEHSILSVSNGDTLTNMDTPIQKHLNTALHDMVNKFGSDFMVTMAPEHPYVQGAAVAWRGFYGGYMPLLNNCRDILTFIHPQYYNNPINEYNGEYYGCPEFGISGYNVKSLVKLSELLITGFDTKVGFFKGLRPDQVAFGVPATRDAAGSGYLPISDYADALDTLIKEYPTFRGIMTWSINYDARSNHEFANAMDSVISSSVPIEPLVINSVSANKQGTVVAGTSVTWNVTASGGNGNLSYQFELYKDNNLMNTKTFSGSNSFTSVLSQPGKYNVKVIVKDDSGNNVTGNSNIITVKAEEKPMQFTNLSVGPSNKKVGTRLTIKSSVSDGIGTKVYSYYIYQSGHLCYKAINTASDSFSFTPNSTGNYLLIAYCKDNSNKQVSSNLTFKVA